MVLVFLLSGLVFSFDVFFWVLELCFPVDKLVILCTTLSSQLTKKTFLVRVIILADCENDCIPYISRGPDCVMDLSLSQKFSRLTTFSRSKFSSDSHEEVKQPRKRLFNVA